MRIRRHLLVFLFYLGVTLVITYPLITVFDTRMIGHPFGDAYEYTHHIWWIKTALQTGQNPFFMPNLVYPDGLSAPLLWSLPLQSFPAWLFYFVMSLPAAFNLSALLTLALNGWAMFVLARLLLSDLRPAALRLVSPPVSRKLKGEVTFPALVAGLVFMLYPAFQGQLGAAHTGLLTLWPVPLMFCCLLRLRDTPHVRRTVLAGALLFMVSLWGSVLLLIYLIAPVTATYFLLLIAGRDRKTLRRALATVIVGGLFALPFVVPLALDTLHAPPEAGAVRYSGTALGVMSPSFYHPLFSAWEYNHRVLGDDPFEQASYIGVIAAALAGIAVVKVKAARPWLGMAFAAWVFSLGPLLKIFNAPLDINVAGYATRIVLPWALVQNLPLISIARTTARFSFAVGFAVALLAGCGAAVLAARLRRRGLRWGVLVGLMIAIGCEYQFWWPLPTNTGIVPAPIAALAQRHDLRAVLDVPWSHPLVNKDGMFLQTGHHLPLIIGQVARSTPADPAKVNLLQDTLDPALLDAAGVDIVIVHKEYDGSDGALGTLVRSRFGSAFYEDDQYAAFEVPKYHGSPPGFTTYADGNNLYFYAPQPGAAILTGQVDAGDRAVAALLDGKPRPDWPLHGTQKIEQTIRIGSGYHRITVALDPACPELINDPLLVCPPLTVSGLALEFDHPILGGS